MKSTFSLDFDWPSRRDREIKVSLLFVGKVKIDEGWFVVANVPSRLLCVCSVPAPHLPLGEGPPRGNQLFLDHER